MSGRDAAAYVEDMVAACERIVAATAAASDDQLTDPEGMVLGHVLHQLTVLGEAAKHIPRDITEAHPEIPWDEMCRLRDRIVHYYFGLQDRMIVLTARVSVPRDLPVLRRIVESLR